MAIEQNTLSIDFRYARVSGNAYTFGYDVEASIANSTSVTIQSPSIGRAVPAWYIPDEKRILSVGTNGYWQVNGKTITFVAGPNESLSAVYSYLKDAVITRRIAGNPVEIIDAYSGNISAISAAIAPVQTGDGDPSLENIRPITGVSSVTVTRTGKNFLYVRDNEATVNGVTFTARDGVITINGTASATTWYGGGGNMAYTDVPPGTYALNGGASVGWYLRVTRANGDFDYIWSNPNGPDVIFTLYEGDKLSSVSVQVNNGVVASNVILKPMFRLANNPDATFEVYQGQSATVSLSSTVYGGVLNVTTGELTVTWENIASYDGETLPDVWMSDRDVYAPGTIPTTEAQVVYKLATPYTSQLTPAQIIALTGYNVVITDTTALDVQYLSDPEIFLS